MCTSTLRATEKVNLSEPFFFFCQRSLKIKTKTSPHCWSNNFALVDLEHCDYHVSCILSTKLFTLIFLFFLSFHVIDSMICHYICMVPLDLPAWNTFIQIISWLVLWGDKVYWLQWRYKHLLTLSSCLLHTLNQMQSLFYYSHSLVMTAFRHDVYELGC